MPVFRETDIPSEREWARYFHPIESLKNFGLRRGMVFLDLGCGYGTFSIPAARIVGKNGAVLSLDIDDKMVRRVLKKAKSRGLKNLRAIARDISSLEEGELPQVDLALLANVIHGVRNKVHLLRQVMRFLKAKGAHSRNELEVR